MSKDLWELINCEPHFTSGLFEQSHRAKLPKGWLVRSVIGSKMNSTDKTSSVSICFVYDPCHEWHIDQEEQENNCN